MLFSSFALKGKNAECIFQRKIIMEHCKNPWESHCDREDIKLYIQLNGEKLPICEECWGHIADQDVEWC
jgi:hypothetical protein